jgi:predicted RNase H-like nuclease (RuvC/YqgF family)
VDFTKLTKQELLDIVSEQQTLKDAVEAKDKEIIQLKEKLKSFDGSVKREELKTYTQQLEEETKKSRDIANQYIRAHRDLMRIFKVNLDFAISHEELLADKLK